MALRQLIEAAFFFAQFFAKKTRPQTDRSSYGNQALLLFLFPKNKKHCGSNNNHSNNNYNCRTS